MLYGLLLILPLLLVLSALASGSETALFGLTASDREKLAERSKSTSRIVGVLLGSPRVLLILILVLNMTINVAYFAVSSVLSLRFADPLQASIMTGAALLGMILFGEVFAKIAAGSARVWVCLMIARPLYVLRKIGWPVLSVLDSLVIAPLSRLVHPDQSSGSVSTIELTQLVQMESLHLSAEEQALLQDVLELRLRRAREIMTPRVDLKWVRADWSIGEALDADQMFIPISGDELHNDVRGTIDVRRVAAGLKGGMVLPPVFVPEQARLDQVLGVLTQRGAECAYCVDEMGAIIGMVLLDDIVDELAAGIGSGDADARDIRPAGEGAWIVTGRLGLRDFAEELELGEVEPWTGSARVSTIGGLVQAELGRMPMVGDAVEVGGLRLEVSQLRGRAVRRVRVRRLGSTEIGDE